MRRFLMVGVVWWICGPILIQPCHAQEEASEAAINAAIEALVRSTSDPDTNVRQAAFNALRRIPASSPELIERVKQGIFGEDKETRFACLNVLHDQEWDLKVKGEILLEMLMHKDPEVAELARENFKRQYQSVVIDQILAALAKEEIGADQRQRLLSVISRNTDDTEKIISVLEDVYANWDRDGQLQILDMIGSYGSNAQTGLSFLSEQTRVEDAGIRLAAVQSITSILRRKSGRTVRRSSDARYAAYVDGMIKRYDSNRDGSLDAEERRNISGSIRLVDANEDGKISRAEAMDSIAGRVRATGR